MSEVKKLDARELMDAIDAHFPEASLDFCRALEGEILRRQRENGHQTIDEIARTLESNLDRLSMHPDHPTIKPTPEEAALLPMYNAYWEKLSDDIEKSRSNRWSNMLVRKANSFLDR